MDGNIGGLITGGGQASVLLIDDESYQIQVEMENIHRHIVGTYKVDFDPENPRIVKVIDGTNPKQWLDQPKNSLAFRKRILSISPYRICGASMRTCRGTADTFSAEEIWSVRWWPDT